MTAGISIKWPDDERRDQTPVRPPRRKGPVVFLLLLLLLALLLWLYSPTKSKSGAVAAVETVRPPTHVFYYNEETETLARYPLGEEQPNPQGDVSRPPVRAYVFQRGFGVDAGEPFIGYLEKPAPGVDPSVYEASKRNYGPDWGKGVLIRRPTDDQWTPANSAEGHAIIVEAYGFEEKCQQGRMTYSR